MSEKTVIDKQYFDKNGLNLHAVFNLSELPANLIAEQSSHFSQLLLFAHGGKQLWSSLNTSGFQSENPVDDFSVQVVKSYFKKQLPDTQYKFVYPGNSSISLIALGNLAGWHFESPFKVGINNVWGSWFAYRVAILANTHYQTTPKADYSSPCITCAAKPCKSACPANALEQDDFIFDKCVKYRKGAESRCKRTCLSRVTCPIASNHQYTDEQLHYHYSVSLKTIQKYY